MARGGNPNSSFLLGDEKTSLSLPLPLPGTAPVYSPHDVYHVGTLDISHQTKTTGDLEGLCLSISEHPEAWTQIARLGGRQTWKGQRLDGSRPCFLEATDLNNDQLNHIISWAVDNDLLSMQKRFVARWEDNELSQMQEMICSSYQEALDEAGDGEGVLRRIVPVALAKLSHWASACEGVAGPQAQDYAIIAFAERSGYDGVWWHEDLDPIYLSAPRGGICPGRIAQWSFSVVPSR